MNTGTHKLRGLTIIGQYSNITRKTYKSKSVLKGVETKIENRLYSQKLDELKAKFSN